MTDITFGNFADMLPCAHTVDSYELTGEELWRAFEHSFKNIKKKKSLLDVKYFLQVSGIKYTVKPTNDEGKRIVSIDVLEGEGKTAKYKPIDKKRTYGVVTTSYLTEMFTQLFDGEKNVR